MNKHTHSAVAFVIGLLLLAAPLSAQTLLNNTTLSAGVTASQTSIAVASSTGLAAGSLIYVPGLNPEGMLITSVSGSIAQVIRGYLGQARPHASSTRVFVDVPQAFKPGPPDITNSCTRTAIDYQPWIDQKSGIVYSCNGEGTNTTGAWYAGFGAMPIAGGSVPLR